FAQAIRDHSVNPLTHEYAPSVLATYRSACCLISNLKGLYAAHPALTSRIWFFWSGVFSSCVRSCNLVFPLLHKSYHPLSPRSFLAPLLSRVRAALSLKMRYRY